MQAITLDSTASAGQWHLTQVPFFFSWRRKSKPLEVKNWLSFETEDCGTCQSPLIASWPLEERCMAEGARTVPRCQVICHIYIHSNSLSVLQISYLMINENKLEQPDFALVWTDVSTCGSCTQTPSRTALVAAISPYCNTTYISCTCVCTAWWIWKLCDWCTHIYWVFFKLWRKGEAWHSSGGILLLFKRFLHVIHVATMACTLWLSFAS